MPGTAPHCLGHVLSTPARGAAVRRGPERRALRTACWLAFFNQAVASTAIINYAPTLMREAGLRSASAASLLTAAIGGSKVCVCGLRVLGRARLGLPGG